MHRLVLSSFLTLMLALVIVAAARAPATVAPPGNAYGAYGCCCPWSAHLGICPVTPGALLTAFDDVCEIHDEAGVFVRYCDAGEDGHYPYRGMTLRQIAQLFGLGNVRGLLDFLCGYDWDKR